MLGALRTGATLTHLQRCQSLEESRGSRTLASVHQDDQSQLLHLFPGERDRLLAAAGHVSSTTSFFTSW